MNNKELILDPRTSADLCRRIEELAASYTPEWRFDRKDPDVGSTLALIFANQMADNIRRMNQLPEKYHTEFVNLLGLNLKPSYPASGIVVVDLMKGTVPGIVLPRGSRLMADSGDGSPILFETVGDVYITNAQLTDILSLSGENGKIIPIAGELKSLETTIDDQGELQPPAEDDSSFVMFDYDEQGIEKNAIMIYHRSVFGADPTVPIQILPISDGGISLAEELADNLRWCWSYNGENGLQPFESVELLDNTVLLRRGGDSVPVTVDGVQYHLICLEALKPIKSAVMLKDVRVASRKEAQPPQLMLRSGEELIPEKCMPLGDTVSLFDECYICDEQVFSQQGATVTLSFELSSNKKLMQLTLQQQADELKIIKRKPTAIQYHTAYTSPQRVVMEYYNGSLWRKIPCRNDWETLFDGSHGGKFDIKFTCPEDWASVPINGYEGRCLRFRVTQADNCYLLPCEHTMPVMKNVTLSYCYEGVWKQPQKLKVTCGTQSSDNTKALIEGTGFAAFRPLPYPAASLYLGFDRPIEGAPVSMLFDVEENVHFRMEPVTFEYSTRNGFKQMKVIDGTDNFSGTGTVLFMPPSDFASIEIEGLQRWWLRIKGDEKALRGYHPLIKSIKLNAVDIKNQQTNPEESFYVETTAPNMTFPLAVKNILSAEVFVSEMGQLSRYQMRDMLDRRPQDVRAEYDFLGEITAFYVRWSEVDSFDRSVAGDRHYMIDRARNLLIFGDGVNVRIPQAQQGASILVRAISCDGTEGNLPAGAVNSFYGNVMFVESVSNPDATYAGSDLEDLDSARRRGADLICGHGRLISQNDFTRAVKAFSGTVEKVKCIAGRDIDGKAAPEQITIAIMTRDYADGASSFYNIREPLRKSLLERCDATVIPECLVISEPVYVTISVSVWAKVEDAVRAFDAQNLILDNIKAFLEPIAAAGRSGWNIGLLPTENHLNMVLRSLRFGGYIDRVIASARYVDKNGEHETSLDNLPKTPFAIGVNGEHKVYIEFQ